MLRTLLICSLFLSVATPGYAASELIGNWITADKTSRFDFLAGFAPKRGVVIEYESGKPKSVEDWEIRPDGVKIGWFTHEYKIISNTLLLGDVKFVKSRPKDSGTIIELKNDSESFIEQLISNFWLYPTNEQKSDQYKKAFSSTSGIYSTAEDEKIKELGAWSFANGVLNIGGTVFPNGRISGEYLFLLTSENAIQLFKQGKESPKFNIIEMKNKKNNFIRKLVSGRWLTIVWEQEHYREFRPIFGDLRGVVFNFEGSDYNGSNIWEYSLETGSIKIADSSYTNAQIQGPFLILLNEGGETETFIRPKGEKSKEYTHADTKLIKVTESDTKTLRNLLERQWYISPDTYKFVFKNNGKEGWLHKFKSYPFIISGNTLNIDGHEYKNVRFVDGKIVIGEDEISYISDSKLVYLAHQSKEAATKRANLEKSKIEDSKRKKLVLILKMKDGARHRILLPVGEMKDIISLIVEPGL